MGKLEELENKISSVDKEKLTDVVKEIKKALDNGDISEKDQVELMKMAKQRLGEPFSGYNI